MRIRAIYAADDAFRALPPSKRKLMREQRVGPLLEEFFQWVKVERAAAQGRNLATKALGYATNQEKELLRVLDDGRLPLDNTRSERSLRKVVVGRNYAESPVMRSADVRRAPRGRQRSAVVDTVGLTHCA